MINGTTSILNMTFVFNWINLVSNHIYNSKFASFFYSCLLFLFLHLLNLALLLL